jgi:hypothetical protein
MSEGSAATGPGDPGATALLYLCMEVAGREAGGGTMFEPLTTTACRW